MEEGTKEQEYSMREKSGWSESHPWLAELIAGEDEVDEVIRYTLDEIRFA